MNMNNGLLPNGWGYVSLDSLCTKITDGTHKTPNYQDRGVRFISIQNLKRFQPIDWNAYIRHISREEHEELTRRAKPEKGDVLVAKIGTLGVAKTIDFEEEVSIFVGLALLKPRRDLILSEYLEGILNSPDYIKLAYDKARGAGRKTLPLVELKKFPIIIPYPDNPPHSLATQRRIVARIEALLAEVREMRELNNKIAVDAEKLYRSIIFDYRMWTPHYIPMENLVNRISPDIEVDDNELYHFAGVYSFGRGVFRGQSKYGHEFSYRRLSRLKTGYFTYPKLMAWEGALGSVPQECDGCVVSPEYPVFEVDECKILPEVLDVYFRTPSIWPRLAELSTGTNARRRRLNPEVLLTYEVPVPPMYVQIQLRKAKAEFGNLQEVKDTTELLATLEQAILAQAFRGEL